MHEFAIIKSLENIMKSSGKFTSDYVRLLNNL